MAGLPRRGLGHGLIEVSLSISTYLFMHEARGKQSGCAAGWVVYVFDEGRSERLYGAFPCSEPFLDEPKDAMYLNWSSTVDFLRLGLFVDLLKGPPFFLLLIVDNVEFSFLCMFA